MVNIINLYGTYFIFKVISLKKTKIKIKADRAKQIKTKAVVNEDPTEKLIKSLQEENAKLKKLLETGGKLDAGSVPANGGGADVDTDEEAALKKQLEENNKAMENMAKTYEEKLKQAQEQVIYKNIQYVIFTVFLNYILSD